MIYTRKRNYAAGLALCALSGLVATPSFAQAAKTDEAKDKVVQLEKYVVTGSNIPTAGEAPMAPVVSISPAQIADSGISNDLLEIIRKTAPQFSGNGNLGNTNGNISSGSTNGASALAMRNAATLVLVNGRRLANAPVAATGGGVFVDVNAIPIEAIQSIEILTDGASAIYGSDAVSGVVNIKLKTDFEGTVLGGRYAFTNNDGKYRERSGYVLSGASNDKGTSITASFEYVKTDPLYNGERSFSRPSYGTTNFAGVIAFGTQYYYLDPSLSAPKSTGTTPAARGYTGPLTSSQVMRLFDLSTYVTQLLSNEKKIGTIAVEQKFGKLTAYGDVLYSWTNTQSQLNAQPVSITMAADDPKNIFSGEKVSVRNRFIDHPRTYKAETESLRAIAGLKGSFNDVWSFDTAFNYNDASQDFSNGGLIRSEERAAAVSSGKLNLFSRTQDPAVINTILGSASGAYTSDLYSLDFKLIGTEIIPLPAGGISIAVGGEARAEKLEATSDPDSQSATFAYDSGTTIDPFNKDRRINSIFLEARVPLIAAHNKVAGVHALDFTTAVRHEIYSDVDDPTVPKFALSYQPVDDSLMFRTSVSRSFAAPTLYQLNSPTGIGFTNPLAEFGGNQGNQMSTPVSGLKPSKSRNINFGVVWTPKFAKGLSVSLDYFDIKQTDLISNLGASGVVDQVFHDVEVNGAASRYASLVHIDDFTGPTISKPGQISATGLDYIYFIIPAASNIGSQKLRGFDAKLSYDLPLNGYGKLHFEHASSYYINYDIQVAPGAPFTKTAGLVTGLNGTIARWRMYNTVNYTLKSFSATVGHSYYPSTRDAGWSEDYVADGYGQYIGYSSWDASVSYQLKGNKAWFKNLKVTLGVDNIGNRMPDKSATYDGTSNADIGEFNPRGRLYYVSGSYKF